MSPTRITTPVFVDAHTHLYQTGAASTGLDLGRVTDRTQLLDALAAFAARRDDPVLIGWGWDDTTWSDRRLPGFADLDRAAGGRPVYLSRVDGHSALISSSVVDRAPELKDLPGWDGTARVERAASRVARRVTDQMITRDQRRAALVAGLRMAAARGIGAVHELSAPHINAAEDIVLLREIAAEEAAPEVVPYWGEHVRDGGLETARALGCVGAAGDLNVDGAIGSRTAALAEPYDDGDEKEHRGHCYLDPQAVADHVIACTEAGLQAGFHCIGDAGTAVAVEGFRLAAAALGTSRLAEVRHRLEHLELIDPAGLGVLAECGVVASVQPAFDALWGGTDGMYAERLGVGRSLGSNAFGAMHRAGIRMAFGSDSPVTPLDPWGAVRAAVRHHNPASRVPLEVAFAAHTAGGWYAARSEAPADTYAEWDVDGPIRPDGLPDLDQDQPLPRCVRTVVRGHTVYESEDA